MRYVKLGILGFGNVARAFLELLPERRGLLRTTHGIDLQVVAICDRTEVCIDPGGFSPESLLASKLEKNVTGDSMGGQPLLHIMDTVDLYRLGGANLILEALSPSRSSGEPALSLLSTFLRAGIPVVTANKSPLVFGYPQLLEASQESGTPFRFGGATAAALPTADLAAVSLAGSTLLGFEGILNGTTNLLLTEMARNQSTLEEELEIAVEMKICEPDPSFDIDGWDTAFKTLILARAFMDPSFELPKVDVQGIRGLAYKDLEPVLSQGKKVKLLGKASYEGEKLRLRVKPSIIPQDHPFYLVDGPSKAITFFTDTLGSITLTGGASSLSGTAAALLKDIINVAQRLPS